MTDDRVDSVFLVQDDSEERRGLAALVSSLGLACEEFPTAEEFLERVDARRPGCAVVDLSLPGLSGLGLHRRLMEAGSTVPVILHSDCWSVRKVIEAMHAGVFLVLEKPCESDELIDGVRKALQAARDSRERERRKSEIKYRLDQLDSRQVGVLDMILAGHSAKAIQHRLRVSRRTVERDRSAILEKTQALSFLELATTLARAGVSLDNAAME
jgi:FixJ family two-component response regulator